MRLLLLGGTAEARGLAGRLHPGVDLVSSLAGRVPDPALPPGPVRVGGFGGAPGLRNWLRDNDITAVVDATHPFAATITANAAAACRDLGVAHLVLHRPPWDPGTAVTVESDGQAAEYVAARQFARVFLTTGRSGIEAFRAGSAWFLIRAVTAPDPAVLPAKHTLMLSRGPYRYADEHALLAGHRVEALVTKNSGGTLTSGKLDAARDLGVEVVMIDRPPLPVGVGVVESVAEAEDWVRGQPG